MSQTRGEALEDRALLLEHVLAHTSSPILWPPEDYTVAEPRRVRGHAINLDKVDVPTLLADLRAGGAVDLSHALASVSASARLLEWLPALGTPSPLEVRHIPHNRSKPRVC